MAAAYSNPPPNNGVKLSATGRSVLGHRREPGRLPAALIAIVVHLCFFALIIFGVSWQVKAPTPLNAEIWRDLPPINTAKPLPVAEVEPTPPKPAEPAPPPPPVATKPAPPVPSKADIALKAKLDDKAKREQQKQEQQKLLQEKHEEQKRLDERNKAEGDKRLKAEEAKKKAADEKVRLETEARESAIRSARQKAVDDYGGKIGALIRNRANIPESVIGKPIVEVRLRLLANGAVLDAQIVRPSGNRAFDDAVERAINGIRQWPLPEDPSILGGRRELNLRIEHER